MLRVSAAKLKSLYFIYSLSSLFSCTSWRLGASLSLLSVTLLRSHQHAVDGERCCPHHPSGTEVLLGMLLADTLRYWEWPQSRGAAFPNILFHPFPMATTAEWQEGARTQSPLPSVEQLWRVTPSSELPLGCLSRPFHSSPFHKWMPRAHPNKHLVC